MSWPMQAAGAWGSAMPAVGAMGAADMNMGSYTAEQWTAMQQQNWQQWAQWQQQYAQWQSQYGEKYAQQMQAMQSMSGMPPLPPNSGPPAPAPPPPDQPPPPPPHENNQPLYAAAAVAVAAKPAPVPPPTQKPANPNLTNVNITAGNDQWSYGTQPAQAAPPAVESEALKKLAEEEKLFDIQFQKWEEEIDKWRQDNVNHPDKQAYKEYEEKFEACRAQLMERRLQMKLKRARLMNVSQPADSPMTGNAMTSAPPPVQNTPSNSYGQNKPQSYNNNQQNKNQNTPYQQQQYNKHYNNSAPPVSYCKGTVDPQDRYDSYQEADDNYTAGYDYSANADYSASDDYSANNNYPSDNSSFLPTSGPAKSIPGLDLVPEVDKTANMQQDVIDITEEGNFQNRKALDYSNISKGINNILGDEKIMNILSMVRGQSAPSVNSGPQNARNAPYNNQNNQTNDQWNRNDNDYNQQHDNVQQYNNNRPNNMPYNNRQEPNFPMQQQNQGQFSRPPPNQNQEQFNRPPPNQNQGQFNRPPPNQNRMFNEMPPNNQDQYYDENAQYGGRDMPPNRNDQQPIRPNVHQPRPLMEVPVQMNENQFSRGPPIRRPPENVRPPSPPRPKWIEEPLFTPSIIVEYEHKPLRLKARDFIEPVHTFDYNHTSKDKENRKNDYEREADGLFSRKPREREDDLFMRKPRRDREDVAQDRYARDQYSRDFERRVPREREEIREDYRHKVPRPEYDDRRRPEDRYDDRRRDDKYTRRDDSLRDREREREKDWDREREREKDWDREREREKDWDRERERDRDWERERDRDINRDRLRDSRRDDSRMRSKSRDRDSRKRELSRDSHETDISKKAKDRKTADAFGQPKHVVMIDDILESPGREIRPDKIVIILRGPPGSGKSYLAKLIRDREAEYGGTVRIMSIDDYFMQEGEVEEKDPTTGKMIKKPTLKYEYDEKLEETYLNSLTRAFKRSLTDGYFTFLIYDAVNEHLKSYADIWNYARQNGFQVYVCTMELDRQICFKRNIHNRSLEDIEVICSRFFPTPSHHIQLDATTLLQNASITEVHMEDVDDDDVIIMEDAEVIEVESVFTSKWEKMDDATQLARLDGTSKPLRSSHLSMEDYLQLDDWTPNKAAPGKKTVRWADIEERRQQEKMRAIGFVVGQTDWNRMTDPTMGSSALTQTKYIERVKRK